MPDWLVIGALALGLVIWLELRGIKHRLELIARATGTLPTQGQVKQLSADMKGHLNKIEDAIGSLKKETYRLREEARDRHFVPKTP